MESYYRAAHRLHGIKRWRDGKGEVPDTETSTMITHLEELAVWHPVDEEQWCGSDFWQWQDIIRELRRKVARFHAVTRPGESASCPGGDRWTRVSDMLHGDQLGTRRCPRT